MQQVNDGYDRADARLIMVDVLALNERLKTQGIQVQDEKLKEIADYLRRLAAEL